MTAEFDVHQHELMNREHAAWLDVVNELVERGITPDDINAGGSAESLHNAIVKWGEELAQLRISDPVGAHADKALQEKRAAYEGQWERGEYPKKIVVERS